MPVMKVIVEEPLSDLSLDHKYRIVLAAFTGYIMVLDRCTREDAIQKAATLCSIAEAQILTKESQVN